MKNDEKINSIDKTTITRDYFDFYIFLLDIFVFWKVIIATILISALIFTSLYYLIEDTYDVKIKVKKLSEAENLINDNLGSLGINIYERGFVSQSEDEVESNFANKIKVYNKSSFQADQLIELFLDNIVLGHAILETAKKFNDDGNDYSFSKIQDNLAIKKESDHYSITLKSKNINKGIEIIKSLMISSDEFSKKSILEIMNKRKVTIDGMLSLHKIFYKQTIMEQIETVNDNILLAEHMNIRSPASKELRLRSDQLLSEDLGKVNSFKIPLYLFGSDALKMMKSILLKRLEKKIYGNRSLQFFAKYTDYGIAFLNSDKPKFVKYDLNTIKVSSNKLPFYFFTFTGIMLGLLIGLLIAFFRASKKNNEATAH